MSSSKQPSTTRPVSPDTTPKTSTSIDMEAFINRNNRGRCNQHSANHHWNVPFAHRHATCWWKGRYHLGSNINTSDGVRPFGDYNTRYGKYEETHLSISFILDDSENLVFSSLALELGEGIRGKVKANVWAVGRVAFCPAPTFGNSINTSNPSLGLSLHVFSSLVSLWKRAALFINGYLQE